MFSSGILVVESFTGKVPDGRRLTGVRSVTGSASGRPTEYCRTETEYCVGLWPYRLV